MRATDRVCWKPCSRLLSRRSRPSIVILEDTQWADEATLDAIRFLGRRMTRTNGVLVLTYRDGDVDLDHPLRSVIGDIPAQSVVRIQLGGLSLDAVTTSLALPAWSPQGAQCDPRQSVPGARDDRSAGGRPGLLQDSVMARVRKLSIGAQEMLKILSVIPEPVDVSSVLRLDLVDEARLDECEQRGLLEREGGRIAFRHELIRRRSSRH